jgi:hypothetical protein
MAPNGFLRLPLFPAILLEDDPIPSSSTTNTFSSTSATANENASASNPNVGQTAGNDPYAGIFFAKDRREEVIEVEEKPEPFTLSLTKMLGEEEEAFRGECATFSEWMSGCPEKGEQE